MQPKEVIFSPNAERQIKALQKKDQKAVWQSLEGLERGADNLSIEKIKSQPNFYRLKASNMRVIYYPLSSERVVVLVIRDRKNVYRDLNNLTSTLNTALRKMKIAR